jgi:hypothetical protein
VLPRLFTKSNVINYCAQCDPLTSAPVLPEFIAPSKDPNVKGRPVDPPACVKIGWAAGESGCNQGIPVFCSRAVPRKSSNHLLMGIRPAVDRRREQQTVLWDRPLSIIAVMGLYFIALSPWMNTVRLREASIDPFSKMQRHKLRRSVSLTLSVHSSTVYCLIQYCLIQFGWANDDGSEAAATGLSTSSRATIPLLSSPLPAECGSRQPGFSGSKIFEIRPVSKYGMEMLRFG